MYNYEFFINEAKALVEVSQQFPGFAWNLCKVENDGLVNDW
jgi:hypothetical protein